MRRVLHIVGTMNRGGAESMIMNLYRSLDRSKYQFDFLYSTENPCDFDSEIQALGGIIYRTKSDAGLSRFTSVLKFLNSHKHFYAVHSHTLLNSGFNVSAAFLARHKIRVSHSHNTSSTTDSSLIQTLYYSFSKLLINVFSNRFVACGIEAGNYLFYKRNPYVVLPNAINFDEFTISGNSNAKNNDGEREIIICQIGRFSEVKNYDFSVTLASYMKENNLKFKMLFVGTGNLLPVIKQIVFEKGLDTHIEFFGLRSDIPKVLSGCDLMIMPSLFEGFPVVLVESQVAGIPAVISDTISPEVDLGVNLVFFESLNSELKVWAETIFRAAKYKKYNEDHFRLLADKGFDVKSSVAILLNIYSGV